MSKIKKGMGVKHIAAIVSEALTKNNITAVLSGGNAASIYANNIFQSKDLDFISSTALKDIEAVLKGIGFKKEGKYFTHPATEFLVEFPAGPLAAGDERIKKWGELETEHGTIQILTPTQCVMDRLASYYSWNDRQGLDQAVWVAEANEIDLSTVEDWSKQEGEIEKFQKFVKRLKINDGG